MFMVRNRLHISNFIDTIPWNKALLFKLILIGDQIITGIHTIWENYKLNQLDFFPGFVEIELIFGNDLKWAYLSLAHSWFTLFIPFLIAFLLLLGKQLGWYLGFSSTILLTTVGLLAGNEIGHLVGAISSFLLIYIYTRPEIREMFQIKGRIKVSILVFLTIVLYVFLNVGISMLIRFLPFVLR